MLFDKALGRQTGTIYAPMCVSAQMAGSKNYRFFYVGTTTTRPTQTKNAFIDIRIEPSGNVKEKAITDMERKNLLAGWSEFRPIDDKTKEIFAKTLSKSLNVPCVPLCVSTQVVSGTNYRFLCLWDHADDSMKKGNAIGVVYADLHGGIKVTGFTNFESENLLKTLQSAKQFPFQQTKNNFKLTYLHITSYGINIV